VVHAKLVEDIVHVVLNSGDFDPKVACNVLVREAALEQDQDLDFSGSEVWLCPCVALASGQSGYALSKQLRNSWRTEELSPTNAPDSGHQFPRAGFARHVSSDAGLDAGYDIAFNLWNAERNQPEIGLNAAEGLDSREAVRHRKVEQHDLRLQIADGHQRFLKTGGRANDSQLLHLTEELGKALSVESHICDDENSNHETRPVL
jgi:hypothetical protein